MYNTIYYYFLYRFIWSFINNIFNYKNNPPAQNNTYIYNAKKNGNTKY